MWDGDPPHTHITPHPESLIRSPSSRQQSLSLVDLKVYSVAGLQAGNWAEYWTEELYFLFSTSKHVNLDILLFRVSVLSSEKLRGEVTSPLRVLLGHPQANHTPGL